MRSDIPEEEVKNVVAEKFFAKFDCTKILGKIDFAVKVKQPRNTRACNDEYLLWAEAKKKPTDVLVMFAQLVITIGKARTFDQIMPPTFLGCYDNEKIAFVPYCEIQDIFYQNDFNWNVAPSNHETREFKLICNQIQRIINNDIPWETYCFSFERDEKELRRFIRENFIVGKIETTKIKIDKNNFIIIYSKWIETVKPTIQVSDWGKAKKAGIIDGDFYLADLLSAENKTLKEKLFVLLKTDHYELDRKIDEVGFDNFRTTSFSDNQKAHTQFWAKYERPPQEEYWEYIVLRRDLLVPQDVRERKGSFFTPRVWVELSQKYIADVLGNDWQDKYYVWDCCAGTGNLLAGLTNKYNIWASTLDKQDVDVMLDRIRNGANLLENHVFQFDFLNDDFSKLPKQLQDIICDETKRSRLIVYINPPYAEASNRRTLERGNEGNRGVEQSVINRKYASILGQGNAELFAQFFTRIYCEIPNVILATFSTLKPLQGQHFVRFREFFLAKSKKMFVCPANTFDNVDGSFPIGFMVWDTGKKVKFKHVTADVYDKEGGLLGTKKRIFAYGDKQYINDWIKPFRAPKDDKMVLGKFPFKGNDFQNQSLIAIVNPERAYNVEAGQFLINPSNLIMASVYFAVRKVIPADWLNDRDQFLSPNKGWLTDVDFQNDCLAYTLFNNDIQARYGKNHWIPFTEREVAAQEKFASSFMTDFIAGKVSEYMQTRKVFTHSEICKEPSSLCISHGVSRQFSVAATAVFDAGRELWKYYHAQSSVDVNASLYDIRGYFQGRNDNGKMNNTSEDKRYNKLIGDLREAIKDLSKNIEPKVFLYGFLQK
jgi:hypothetical protein